MATKVAEPIKTKVEAPRQESVSKQAELINKIVKELQDAFAAPEFHTNDVQDAILRDITAKAKVVRVAAGADHKAPPQT